MTSIPVGTQLRCIRSPAGNHRDEREKMCSHQLALRPPHFQGNKPGTAGNSRFWGQEILERQDYNCKYLFFLLYFLYPIYSIPSGTMWLAGSELSLVTPRLDAFRSIMICREMKKNILQQSSQHSVSPRLKSQPPTFEHISCKLVAMFLAGESQRKTWHFRTWVKLSRATYAKSLFVRKKKWKGYFGSDLCQQSMMQQF